MKLDRLIEVCKAVGVDGNLSCEIKGITCDSREVRDGYLFAALKGEKHDGHDFIDAAISKGAAAVMMESPVVLTGKGVVSVLVENSRKALGRVSSRFYSEPSRELKIAGVTGTNGKTTTTYIMESILTAAGRCAGVIGTINYRYAGKIIPAPNTTPESSELQSLLASMRDAGVTDCVMEVSSHGLHQYRTEGCSFDTAVFTNLSQDHLDYHSSMEDYGRSKEALFFDDPYKKKQRVINIDDSFGKVLSEKYNNVISFGMEAGDIHPLDIVEKPDGFNSALHTPLGEVKVETALVGIYNLYNIMAAAGAAISFGIKKEAIEEGVRKFIAAPGRLEPVTLPEKYKGCRVFVDYAHTPDALERVIKAIKPTTGGIVVTLFGCGGDRDSKKRSLMGAIAVNNSDFTIITSDNPRNEDPLSIIEDIERGAVDAGAKADEDYCVIVERKNAIREAARLIKTGDTLLIAGKGHEDYQILGNNRIYFDDRVEAENAFWPAMEDNGRAADNV